MNGYSQSQIFSNPYTDRRYGTALSATQGFLNSYMQMRGMLVNEQYRKSLMDMRRTGQEREEKRLGFEERRLKLAERKDVRMAAEPEKYSTEWFEGALGYSPETSQLLQDRRFGAAPKLQTPQQQLTAGKIMVENALTAEQILAGQELMNEAMETISQQRSFLKPAPPSKKLFEQPQKTEEVSDGREMTEEELDDLIAEFGGDETAIRKAAKERGLMLPR